MVSEWQSVRRPPYQTDKTVHVHEKHFKHNKDGCTALGVRQWFCIAKPLGEWHYENWNTHTNQSSSHGISATEANCRLFLLSSRNIYLLKLKLVDNHMQLKNIQSSSQNISATQANCQLFLLRGSNIYS